MTVRVPGKLYVSGEYAIVEPGQSAVLISVDRYLSVSTHAPGTPAQTPAHEIISADSLHQTFTRGKKQPGRYVHAAAMVMDMLRTERGLDRRVVDLQLHNELRSVEGTKYGLGSSGAVTLGVIAAFDQLYDLALTPTQLYRLALLASITISPRASGGDLASAVTGGWTFYTSPDRSRLPQVLSEESLDAFQSGQRQVITEALTHPGWEGSGMRRLEFPEGFTPEVLVGWSGAPATTDDLVTKVHTHHAHEAEDYQQLMEGYRQVVLRFAHALEAGDMDAAKTALRETRQCLLALQDLTGTLIETPDLARLVAVADDLGVAAKSSGAGGGDCGIALAPQTIVDQLAAHWRQAGIEPLDLAVSPHGVQEVAPS